MQIISSESTSLPPTTLLSYVSASSGCFPHEVAKAATISSEHSAGLAIPAKRKLLVPDGSHKSPKMHLECSQGPGPGHLTLCPAPTPGLGAEEGGSRKANCVTEKTEPSCQVGRGCWKDCDK